MSRASMLIPKKSSITLSKANNDKRMTTPTIAFVILPLADSIPALSPPEVIHWIAPVIMIKKKTITPTRKANPTILGKRSWKNPTPDFDCKEGFKAGFVIGSWALMISII